MRSSGLKHFIESAPYGIAVIDLKRNEKFIIFNSQLEKNHRVQKRRNTRYENMVRKMYPDKKYRESVIKENKKIVPGEDLRIREAVISLSRTK